MDLMKSNKRKLVSPQMDSKKPKITPFILYFPSQDQFLDSCLPQRFSLPIPIMKYIWSNPSTPEVYQKLIQCCRIFFLKNPIVVINNLEYNIFSGWQYCNSNKCAGRSCGQKHRKICMDKFENSKIWVSKRFCIAPHIKPNLISTFIPKIYRYDVQILTLSSQNISYDELKFFAAGVKECHLFWNTVKYENGQEVELENIIQLFSGSQKVYMNFALFPSNSVCKNYIDFISACQTVKEVVLQYISDIFDIPTFYQHLKRSQNRCLISILSDVNDYARLNEVINEILKTKSFEFVPPVIEYSRHKLIKNMKMKEIQAKEAAKYQ